MSLITAIVKKDNRTPSGLDLYRDNENRILINNIYDGIFSNTILQPSMEIVSVNGISVNGMAEYRVKSMIDDASGQVTIIAREQEIVVHAYVVDGGNQVGNDTYVPVPVPVPSAPVMPHVPDTPTKIGYPTPAGSPGSPNEQHELVAQQPAATGTTSSSHPPPGCREGGRWMKVKYSGNHTLLLCVALAFCFGIFSGCGACAFLCPQDEKDVYLLDKKVYDRSGKYIGLDSAFTFV